MAFPSGSVSVDSVNQILERALAEITASDELSVLDDLRVRYLGKKGEITALLKSLGGMEHEQRKAFGQAVNTAKGELAKAVSARKQVLEELALNARLASETIDVTLPGRGQQRGGLHPVTHTLQRMTDIFSRLGYDIATGPEVEDDYYNFESLNFPPHHPARAMHDTFYFGDGRLLRTHTSPVQIREMMKKGAPIRIIAPGKVYRSDSDQTHTPMFHQVEGLLVDKDISFAHLKGILYLWVKHMFGEKVKLRFRPSFFPFTEPSAEMDVSCSLCAGKGCRVCSQTGWLEIGGCGSVDPNVFKNVNIDPEVYSGFAFGFGIDRITMIKYGIPEIGLLTSNDNRFLKQF